jgi:hypothetical protein
MNKIYQPNRHDHLSEVEKENMGTLPDRVIGLSAQSVSTVFRCADV